MATTFFNQNYNNRYNRANFRNLSSFRIGKNLLSNRLGIINNKIPHEWLNMSFITFKLKCNSLFLKL